MRTPLTHLLVLSALGLAACGGGGGGGDGGDAGLLPVEVAVFHSYDMPVVQALCGTITNGGEERVRLDIQCAGDLSDNVTRRCFYTFTTAGLPPEAAIQSAILTTQQYLVVGHPFEELGNLIVDHVDVESVLDETDYFAIHPTLDIGTLTDHSDLGTRSLDVTDAVRSDFEAGRPWTSLRLRHERQTNIDGTRDYTAYSSPDWPEDYRRVSLVIVYLLPTGS